MSDGKISSYRDLIVWRKGIDLVKAVYLITRRFPADERFGLTTQIRRAAVSVPSNIAEGQARRTTGEFIHALSHSEGSLAEVDTQLVIAIELGYCKQSESEVERANGLVLEMQKMLTVLRAKLQHNRTTH